MDFGIPQNWETTIVFTSTFEVLIKKIPFGCE